MPPTPLSSVCDSLAGGHEIDAHQLLDAWRTARADLLSEQNAQGYWPGELSSSPLSTATAISALSIAEQHAANLAQLDSFDADASDASDRWSAAYQADLSELIVSSVRWLAGQQNPDGGWGDTDRSGSNLATTLLVLSAFRMTGVPAKHPELEPRAEQYVRSQGGVAGLKKRYGRDKTFAAPILANCALAGIVPWKQVPTLPFELAAAPRSWFRLLGLPVVSYAIPALVAIGLAKHHHRPSLNPVARLTRRLTADRCLELVAKMQPDSGGFLEATPLTSFVVMALASAGRADHPVVRRGVEFLFASVRPDGSWPIDTNLATWNTTMAVNALEKGVRDRGSGIRGQITADGVGERAPNPESRVANPTLRWLLACQHLERHPFTEAAPGGWAWTNLSGGVPDADDTAGALLALRTYWPEASDADRTRIAAAVDRGVRWLLGLQNHDGGWPTFCRGWGALPFDRSATDLTAHVLRALHAWRGIRGWGSSGEQTQATNLNAAIDAAVASGLRYLADEQAEDGSWTPLWFGNEHRPNEANPVFGTARVLLALAEVEDRSSSLARRGLEWLVREQHANGGWGSDPQHRDPQHRVRRGSDEPAATGAVCSVEETSVAVEALLAWQDASVDARAATQGGLSWLIDAVERGATHHPAPIGLYFAKLWYYERLYPKSLAVGALGAAVERCVARESRSGEDISEEAVASA